MAGDFNNLGKDSLDITELASLNDEITDEMIEQLEQKLAEQMGISIPKDEPVNENDDSTLFEETVSTEKEEGKNQNPEIPASTPQSGEDTVTPQEETVTPSADDEEKKLEKVEVKQDFDDNFIKKYKAKLKNRAQGGDQTAPSYGGVAPDENVAGKTPNAGEEGPIETLSQGNISERALTGDLKKYNDSLDYLDKNVKYSKYVIYIDPQNVNFIEGLTVKERKNLINEILRQQDDISITKLRFKVIQSIIRHVIIAVLTISISIPVIYHVINASLEATINNHRNAQTNWQTLYKEHGKITHN